METPKLLTKEELDAMRKESKRCLTCTDCHPAPDGSIRLIFCDPCMEVLDHRKQLLGHIDALHQEMLLRTEAKNEARRQREKESDA